MRKAFVFLLTLILLLGTLPMTVPAAEAPFTLEVPEKLTAELKKDTNGVPYFELRLNVPQSVKDLNAKLKNNPEYFEGKVVSDLEIVFDYKYGKYDWNEGPSQYWNTSAYLTDYLEVGCYEFYPFDSSTKFEEVNIKSEVYSFRAHFYTLWGYEDNWTDNEISSGYSNIATIGNPAYWSTASDWATPELEKAANAGLIPEILKGADMTKPITREEFAELAVLLYDRTTEKPSIPAAPNPFKDTTNPQILKAYKLGITAGTSATTFEPKTLVNREQCAAMLFRAIKAIKPDGNYSIEGVKDFPDQKYISSWAVEATKYMSKTGIITGDTDGNFMPKATTSAQEAAGYGMATREQAIALSMRTYKNLEGSVSQNTSTTASSTVSAESIIGLWSKDGPSGNIVDPATGYSTGSIYNGEWYLFKSDGTFRYVIIGSGTIISGGSVLEGKYAIGKDEILLTDIKENWYPDPSKAGQKEMYKNKSINDKTLQYELKEEGKKLVFNKTDSFFRYEEK